MCYVISSVQGSQLDLGTDIMGQLPITNVYRKSRFGVVIPIKQEVHLSMEWNITRHLLTLLTWHLVKEKRFLIKTFRVPFAAARKGQRI
jgi:hypothetical protein